MRTRGICPEIYRTVEIIGRRSDGIVMFLSDVLRKKYGVGMGTVLMNWTSIYFETARMDIVRVGHSRDHWLDKPQVTVGLSIDKVLRMPVGLTNMPGNVLDVTHFKETLAQIRALPSNDAIIVFDNGAYSKENSALLDGGMGFVTHM